ncbi:hypothetical protein L4D06_15985 [Enterovibrio makurazakiensis]|uniref:hypothetical protein n=1 Tax=Enterovibrio makurazakiensis TaxID=2910232 RepID=UPI003D2501F6
MNFIARFASLFYCNTLESKRSTLHAGDSDFRGLNTTDSNHTPFGSATLEPCIANGGSPFWYKDYPRVTEAILTGPYCHLYRYCGMTSKKSMSDIGNVRHRVDSLSTKNSSKEVVALPNPLSALRTFLFSPDVSLAKEGIYHV